jgi:CRISPR-associated protein Csd1
MLELLVDYARRKGLAVEPGFAPKLVKWLVLVSPEGHFVEVLERGDTSQKRNRGETFPCAPELSQPELIGGGGRRHFLIDNAEVVSLLSKGEITPKHLAKHEAFVSPLERAAKEGAGEGLAPLGVVARCLRDEEQRERLRLALQESKASPTDNVTFAIDKEIFALGDAWHPWWRRYRASIGNTPVGDNGGDLAVCLASGKLSLPARTNPKIRGLSDVGGLPTGDALISFDKPAFGSYGLQQGENAAVSEEMAAAYRAALEYLVSHSVRLPGLRVLYWYEGPELDPEDDPMPWFSSGPRSTSEADEVTALNRARDLLRSIQSGQQAPSKLPDRYHVLVVSGASGRVMVRSYRTGPFMELLAAVVEWFNDLSIVQPDGQTVRSGFKIYDLFDGLVRKLKDRKLKDRLKDLPTPLVDQLWASALGSSGAKLPATAASRALDRIRSDVLKGESDPPLSCWAMLKAFVIRQGGISIMPGLETSETNPAYNCGRLLAVLSAVQYSALGDVGAGVVQRYYAAASATPAMVIGRLLRGAQFHLDKLEPRLRSWHQSRLAEVAGNLSLKDLPTTLGLEGQSHFALGYYHQIAADRAASATRKAAKTAASNQNTEENADA